MVAWINRLHMQLDFTNDFDGLIEGGPCVVDEHIDAMLSEDGLCTGASAGRAADIAFEHLQTMMSTLPKDLLQMT